MTMTGMPNVLRNIRAAGEDIQDVTAQGMVLLAEKILERAKQRDLMPYKSGDLMESGAVNAQNRNAFSGQFSATVARIVFSAPYAVRQHEDTSLNHPNGGGPKFLERAVDEFSGGKGLAIVAGWVRNGMNGQMKSFAGSLTGQIG